MAGIFLPRRCIFAVLLRRRRALTKPATKYAFFIPIKKEKEKAGGTGAERVMMSFQDLPSGT